MKRIEWKVDHGLAVQIGITGAIDTITEIAGWLNERFSQSVILLDDFKGKASVLSSLKSQVGDHYRVPPTIKGDVKMYPQMPEGNLPIHFLSVPTDARFELETVARRLHPGSIIYGSPDACADVLEAAELAAQPIFYCGGMLAVRAA